MKKIVLLFSALVCGICSFAGEDKAISRQELEKLNVIVTYPEWKLKAVSFSYDDGHKADIPLISIFNKYAVKATFNIPFNWFNDPRRSANRIPFKDIHTIYAGHEIAGHGFKHKTLTLLKPKSVSAELDGDIETWKKLSGKALLGYAYPYGRFNDNVLKIIREKGFVYARTCKMAGNFDLPQDFLAWHPYCHHNRVKGLAKKFLDYKAERMSVLIVWGHSYEFPASVNKKTGKPVKESWHVIENFCKAISGKPEIWYATMGDIALYVKNSEALRISADNSTLTNNSGVPVYFLYQGEKVKLEPAKSFKLKK